MRRYVVIFLLLFSTMTQGSSVDESALVKVVHEKSGLFPLTARKGPFGTEGEQYIAAIASPVQDSDSMTFSLRLIVFKDNKAMHPSLAQSQIWETGGNLSWDVRFKKMSLFLDGDFGSCGAVCHSMVSFRFQNKGGEYLLTGVDRSNVEAFPHVKGDRVDRVFLVTTTKSINLLTNKVRYSGEKCRASDSNPWDCVSKSKVYEKVLSFASDRKWTLEEFSPDLFSDFEDKTENLHGYINDDLRYIENNH